jgi:hypothetical protein
MSDTDGSFEPVFARIVKSIDDLEGQLLQKKRLANELCKEYGRPPRYLDTENQKAASLTMTGRDVFYGRPMATVVREFLEMRGPSNQGGLGAATVNEIYDAIVGGGFKFETKDEANAKRSLRIALAKNTATFHKVGTGAGSDAYGLTEWYPSVRVRAERKTSNELDVEGADGAPPDDEGATNASDT